MHRKLSDIFSNCENYNLDNIIIKNNKLHDFSKFVYGNHNFISDKIDTYADAKFNKVKDRKKFKKQDFSIELLNNILEENVFKKIKIDTETYKDSFSKFCFCPIDFKGYFDFCLDFCNNIMHVFRDVVKLFDINDIIDLRFNMEFEEISNFYRDFNKVFNCTRNFATKRNEYIKSYILNFGNPLLNNPGWSESKIKENLCILLVKNSEYYLGLLTSKNFEFEITDDTNHSYGKMVNMQLGDINKQCPRMVFTKGVKNHFENSNEIYVLDNGCKITREHYDIYVSQKVNKDFFENNKESLVKYIDLFKNYFMNCYENRHFFDFSNIKTASEYKKLDDFYKDLSTALYHTSFEHISDRCMEKLQNENKLWLFRLNCQDFSEFKKLGSNKNVHTLIFETFFSEENKSKHFPIRLNGGFEIRYRDEGLTDGVIHKKGSILLNKNDKNGNRIPDTIYCKLLAFLNGKSVELSNEEKYYTENDLLIKKIAQYDIVKDRRYIKPKYEIRLPFKLNSTAENLAISKINDMMDKYVKSNKCNIIGIDRGERNLLCLTVIDYKGKVLERRCLDKINNVNYNELMTIIEKDRKNQRKSWKGISKIKNVKKGYISYAVKEIVDLIEKYNAIICLEALNEEFMQTRTKIEKSIYREFVKQLVNKLSYMIVNKKESIIGVKQLAFNECKDEFHNGIIYYVEPSYTSKIDHTTGFANLFNFRKITNNETRKDFFEKMNYIKYENNLYKFGFDYKNFNTHTNHLDGNVFSVDSYGVRIKRFKNNEGYWDSQEIDLTKELNKLFENVDIANKNIKDVIINDEKICSKVFDLFKLIVQIRNTDSNNDYLISPVKNNFGIYYDTRCIMYEDQDCNPDMEASYNIAIKGMMKIYNNKPKNKDYFDYFVSQNQ